MRVVTREVAFDPAGWTPARAEQVASLFNSLAPEWNSRNVVERHDAIRDALARGGPFPDGVCLEIGAGTGSSTPDLQAAFANVVSTDLSTGMLALFGSSAPLVQADASRLPLRDGSVAVVALINMFLFPAEIDRVLAADGVLVWVSSIGDATPIYLDADDVVGALPGEWEAVTSEAGWGTWTTARRAAVS